MVYIMSVTKKSIETTKNTTKKAVKTGVNTFKLNEKTMTLTLELPVEWNANHSVLKAKNLEKVKGKEYQKMVFSDTKGNEVYLFKTGFNYESVVKETAKGVDLNKAKEVLSDDEQALLKLLLKKMSK